ncbi:Bax inhibitor-1/YccA family protein [Lactococcus chungangensis]|jgi:FtsH-binding integral membrane protein|uniref:Bax inhibitor-1/YccA family protein n=1 Tax=Pseudolactococcus chungangensis TaxID=451457 RepID=UPI0028CFE3EA|nr:Bax inhibitor-1/YccA family protein [Lactococcus chungangensis]MDD3014878.1 Bax inhibitor-1/YccA family protein [Lactococcus chungangensis]
MDNQIFETNQHTGKFSLADFFARIYALVGMGIAVSAVVAFITLTVFADNISAILTGHTWLLFVLWILEMVLVVAVTPMAAKNSPMALPAFIGFSALNGFTLTFTLAYFDLSSIAVAFAITAGMFFALSIFGKTTKRDLSGMGKAMFAALIGIIIASVVNLFVGSSGMDFMISILSVIVFSGLIAWDNQRIEMLYNRSNGNVTDGWAVSMALSLYLDFINLFISILRIFGIGGSKD